MGARTGDLVAISLCGVAWLTVAALLTMDWLGRPQRGCFTRARRTQGGALLAILTCVLLTSVAGLRNWPRDLRLTLDGLTMAAGLAAVTVFAITPLGKGGRSAHK